MDSSLYSFTVRRLVNTSTTPSEFTPYLVLTPNSIIIDIKGDSALVDLKTNTNVIKVE